MTLALFLALYVSGEKDPSENSVFCYLFGILEILKIIVMRIIH